MAVAGPAIGHTRAWRGLVRRVSSSTLIKGRCGSRLDRPPASIAVSAAWIRAGRPPLARIERALMYGIKIAHNQAEPRPPIGSAMLTV
jgi:hypothetical protein